MTSDEIRSMLDDCAKVCGDFASAAGKLATFFQSLEHKAILIRLLSSNFTEGDLDMPNSLSTNASAFKTACVPQDEHATFDSVLFAHDASSQGKLIDFFQKLFTLLGGVINWKCFLSPGVIMAVMAGNIPGAIAAYLACANVAVPPGPTP